MDQNKRALERAFEMARSGAWASCHEIRVRLKAEGYPNRQLEGRALIKQILDIIKQARAV